MRGTCDVMLDHREFVVNSGAQPNIEPSRAAGSTGRRQRRSGEAEKRGNYHRGVYEKARNHASSQPARSTHHTHTTPTHAPWLSPSAPALDFYTFNLSQGKFRAAPTSRVVCGCFSVRARAHTLGELKFTRCVVTRNARPGRTAGNPHPSPSRLHCAHRFPPLRPSSQAVCTRVCTSPSCTPTPFPHPSGTSVFALVRYCPPLQAASCFPLSFAFRPPLFGLGSWLLLVSWHVMSCHVY